MIGKVTGGVLRPNIERQKQYDEGAGAHGEGLFHGSNQNVEGLKQSKKLVASIIVKPSGKRPHR